MVVLQNYVCVYIIIYRFTWKQRSIASASVTCAHENLQSEEEAFQQ